ncbi:MAG TPA: heme ABC transporter permease CcmC [bacterium]|nr:heme ABC transporter permease CcmC [bacterium]
MSRILGWLSLSTILLGLLLALLYAPPDAVQGQVQRIMYLHVPTIWVAFMAFFVVFVASILYLWKKTLKWDLVARSSAEIGVMFTFLGIVGGSIWGKPTWGVWWTWDARLTTTTILLFIYIGYLMLRSYMSDDNRKGKYAAVVGIVGFLDIPIVHQSVVWWRTLHQPPTIMRMGEPTIAPSMLLTLLVNLLAFTLLYSYLLSKKFSLENRKEILARLRAED